MGRPRKGKNTINKERMLHVMKTDPRPVKVLAARFGFHPVYIRRLARKEGIKLPKE